MTQQKKTDRLFQPFPGPADPAYTSEQIYVGRFETGLQQWPERQHPHRHAFFEVFWFREGGIKLFHDFASYEIGPQTLVFVSPGQIHTWVVSQDISGIVICFFEEAVALRIGQGNLRRDFPFFSTYKGPPLLQMTSRAQHLDFLSEAALDAFYQPGEKREELVTAYLTAALIEALRAYKASPSHRSVSAAAQLTRDFHLLAEEHYLDRKQVQDYANMLGVTANHLVQSVREITGTTPGHLLRDRLILEAKRLLIHTEDTIAEIAHVLSFSDPSVFGRWFKAQQGDSPGQFRASFHL
ncbi:transcriptional family [Leptolyngbya sp. Heron Island J]|nr:transcriptional family [Leptolyngbya sp. Heron Island J]